MHWVFLVNGTYGVALALLIASWRLHSLPVRLFVGKEYGLGSHGQVWKDWHTTGCAYAGAVNLLAWSQDFHSEALMWVAVATAGLYGVWSAQNLNLVLRFRGPRFRPLMWAHVILCALCSVLALAAALSHRA
jgi:hypothetical protein